MIATVIDRIGNPATKGDTVRNTGLIIHSTVYANNLSKTRMVIRTKI